MAPWESFNKKRADGFKQILYHVLNDSVEAGDAEAANSRSAVQQMPKWQCSYARFGINHAK